MKKEKVHIIIKKGNETLRTYEISDIHYKPISKLLSYYAVNPREYIKKIKSFIKDNMNNLYFNISKVNEEIKNNNQEQKKIVHYYNPAFYLSGTDNAVNKVLGNTINIDELRSQARKNYLENLEKKKI
jgi:predicted MPP superfamily phosphohydrolase